MATCTLAWFASAASAADQHYTIDDHTITFSYGATDADMAVVDSHPDLKVFVIVNEPSYGPDPATIPLTITDAGFAHIANCKKLEKLLVGSSHTLQVTDDELKALEGLKELRVVQLMNQPFSDAGIAHLSKLENLEELWLDSDRNVADGALETASKLKKLRVLRFYDAPITDAGVEKVKDLANLEDLQLGMARVGDAGMVVIGKLMKLKTLDLQHTQVTDEGLPKLKSLKLHWLCLNGTRVSSTGLASLANMTDLDSLFLEGTQIDDAGLDHLSQLKKLKYLCISGTHVTEAG